MDGSPKDSDNVKNSGYFWTDIWSNCRLLGTPLIPPLFSDCKGSLFNKESILEWLLVKPEYKSEEYTQVVIDAFSHIKLRKDLVELTNLVKRENEPIGVSLSGPGATTTDLVVGNRKKYGYIDTCGHVNILSRLDSETKCCVCDLAYTKSNVVIINPTEAADVQRLLEREHSLRAQNLSHSRKPRQRKSSGKSSSARGSNKKQKLATKETTI